MAKGLGASLWAWLNKPDAVAYLERALEDERGKREKAEAREKELRRRESGSARDLAVERLSHRDARASLGAAERELLKLREVYATHLAAHSDLAVRFARAVKEKAEIAAESRRNIGAARSSWINAVLDADVFLGLAESYAAENDELRRSIGDAGNRLDRAG